MKSIRFTTAFVAVAALAAAARAVTPENGRQRLSPVPIQKVTIDDPFWSPKLAVWRSVTIPHCLAHFESDGVLANFDHVARGELSAPHGGAPWFDGLTYEMIRAIADFLAEQPDPALKARVDGYIDHITAAAARDPDGYLNTYTQLKEPAHRWGQNGGNDLWQHDLYNAACMVDAAVHYYRATGDTRLLTTAVRMTNGMCQLMGPAPKKNIIPGHALGEEALVGLYELFKSEPALAKQLAVPVNPDDYLALAKFWIDARGHHEGRNDFNAYDQDEIPVLQQQTLEGHAVRATLMGCGLAAVAMDTAEPGYFDAAQRLWSNYVDRRMYLTGVVGSFAGEEKFGPDYVLPNDCYGETCAAVGNAFFDQEMSHAFGEADAFDEFERALYNGALAGVSLKGNRYFYENPLESGPARKRWDWHSCPCCPPMFLKLMGALPGSIYETDASGGLYVNLFIGSHAAIDLPGTAIDVVQSTQYPWSGDVHLAINPAREKDFTLYIRVPAWSRGGASNGGLYTSTSVDQPNDFIVKVNGKDVAPESVHGYAGLTRRWKRNDVVDVHMAMPVCRVTANPHVEADRGRAAIMRGPIVYCVESPDNGGHVRDLSFGDAKNMKPAVRQDLLGGITVLHGSGRRLQMDGTDAACDITAIPYYANANRGPAEMMVWLPTNPSGAIRPTIANRATASASHVNPSDSAAAISEGPEPKSSADNAKRRFTWWSHRGTPEWVQYTFDQARTVSDIDVYWWDDAPLGGACRVPQSWRLLYRNPDGVWVPVPGALSYGLQKDAFNSVHFDPVTTDALRIEAQLQPKFSGGILQWRVRAAPTK